MTPTARSMKHLRSEGFIVARVEQRLHMPKAPFPITKDAFNFGDLLAAREARTDEECERHGRGIIALVQVTSSGNMRKRQAKIAMEPLAAKWKQAGGLILLHGWAKRGPRGKRKTWTLKAEQL